MQKARLQRRAFYTHSCTQKKKTYPKGGEGSSWIILTRKSADCTSTMVLFLYRILTFYDVISVALNLCPNAKSPASTPSFLHPFLHPKEENLPKRRRKFFVHHLNMKISGLHWYYGTILAPNFAPNSNGLFMLYQNPSSSLKPKSSQMRATVSTISAWRHPLVAISPLCARTSALL